MKCIIMSSKAPQSNFAFQFGVDQPERPHVLVNTGNPSLLHTVGLGLRKRTHRQTKPGEVRSGGAREKGLRGHDGWDAGRDV